MSSRDLEAHHHEPSVIRFFDSHAHLDGNAFAGDLDQAIARAREAGVTDVVCIGASEGFDSNARAIAIAERDPGFHATVGVHPHDANVLDGACLEGLRALARHPKVVAIGETGLDYHYDHAPREKQLEAFRAQVELARELERPLVIHTREAEEDTIAVLREARAHEIGGVIHCFTGTPWLAQVALDLGFSISFSGVLTFRNAEPLRAIAAGLPRDRVLVETDCPYLAPIPHRGKRNEPAWIVETAKTLAGLWSVSLADVKRMTGENTARLFKIPFEGL